jgi:hypothetical protein
VTDETKELLRGVLRQVITRYLPWLIAAAASALAAWLGLQPPPPPVVIERVAPPPDDPPYPPGWVIDPDEVARQADRMPTKRFGSTPAGLASDIPAAVYLWKAHEHLLGRPPAAKDQGPVGSCVGFGSNTAVERTLAAEILDRKGGPSEWTLFAEEVTYAGSRVDVGLRQIRGDGSVGAWAARYLTRWGAAPRQRYPVSDLTLYSPARCREWGYRGVPQELVPTVKQYPVKDAALIKSWGECKRALASGYAVAVCSTQGFTRDRDSNGVARPSGVWAHCMAIDGYHTEGQREFGHVVNSWGSSYHRGPLGWGSPPEGGFWADAAVLDRMLRQGDSWAFSGVTGFPRRKLDWFVAVPREPDRLGAFKLEIDWCLVH